MYDSEQKSSFAGRVKSARYQAGLEQADLAELLGVSIQAVQSWEQGKRWPRARMLSRIAEATGKPVSWFFDEVAA